MKNLFKKSFAEVLSLSLFLIVSGILLPVNTINAEIYNTTFSYGGAGSPCSFNGTVKLDKFVYAPGEQIVASAQVATGCTPPYVVTNWGVIAANDETPYVTNSNTKTIASGGGGTTGTAGFASVNFTAPNVSSGGTHFINFVASMNGSGGVSYSSSPTISYMVVVPSTPPGNFKTPPTIVNPSVLFVTDNAVGVSAEITGTGMSTVSTSATLTERGFCYFKNSESPSSAICKISGGTPTLGSFSMTPLATNLTADTDYWFYGYAKNSVGLEADAWSTFKTTTPPSGTPPTVDLQKDPLNVKNVVKKGSAGGEGSAYFVINVQNLTSGSCKLVNLNNPSEDWGTYSSKFISQIPVPTVSALTAANNVFQLDCSGSSSPLLKSGTQTVTAQSGTLTVPTTCGIPVGASSCTNVPVSWSTISPYSTTNTQANPPLVTQVKNKATGVAISLPMNTGSTTISVPYSAGGVTYEMKNSIDAELSMGATPNLLDTKTITPYCIGGTWNGATSKCVATAMTGTLTASPNPCTIASGASTCTTTLSWSIDNTEAVPSAITANGMTDISLSTPTIGNDYSGTKSATVPYPSRTFYLYNNAKSLVPDSPMGVGVTVTSICAAGSIWNGTICAPAMTGTLTASPNPCTIASGASTCTTTLSWSIDNTEAVPSAITANGMTDISLSTPTIGNDYSGTKSATVPYPSRTFYLYNNAKSLVPSAPAGLGLYLAAECSQSPVKTIWNGTVCEAENKFPVVNAGPDQVITLPTTTVTMAGTATDSDGTIASKTWTKFSTLPAGLTSTITNTSSLTTTITGLTTVGEYVYRLTVVDNKGATATDDVKIAVTTPPDVSNVTLTAVPSSTIVKGRTTYLKWTSTNANTCTGTNFDTGGAKNNSTGVPVHPTISTKYTLTCTSVPPATGIGTADITIRVVTPEYIEN